MPDLGVILSKDLGDLSLLPKAQIGLMARFRLQRANRGLAFRGFQVSRTLLGLNGVSSFGEFVGNLGVRFCCQAEDLDVPRRRRTVVAYGH